VAGIEDRSEDTSGLPSTPGIEDPDPSTSAVAIVADHEIDIAEHSRVPRSDRICNHILSINDVYHRRPPHLIKAYLNSLPLLPKSIPLLIPRTKQVRDLLQHLNPKRGWAGLNPVFHHAFQSLWSEYFRCLERLRDVGGVRQSKVPDRRSTGGVWVGQDLRTQDFDPIILSLIRAPRFAIASTDSWTNLSIAKVVGFLSSIGVAPTTRQLHLLVQHYALDSIFRLESAPSTPKVIRNARRQDSRSMKELAGIALEAWGRRRRLGTRVEALICGVRLTGGAADELERWMEMPMLQEASYSDDVWQLRMTLGEMTMCCLEEAIRLKALVEGEEDMLLERSDLDYEVRYWTARRDEMVPLWREELLVEGGLLRRWEGAKEDESIHPSEKEEFILKLLLRDSLLQHIRYIAPALDVPGVPRLDDPLDLTQLLLGRPGSESAFVGSNIIGGAIIRARNAFYHQRRFSDLLSLVGLLAPPSPCPPLQGKIIASLFCAARNPEQFARLLVLLIQLPTPLTPVVIDKSTRRLLLKFADDADLIGLDDLIPPNVRDPGFRGLLLKAFDQWGTGLPGDIKLDEQARAQRDNHVMSVKLPRVFGQRSKGKHLEWIGPRSRSRYGR